MYEKYLSITKTGIVDIEIEPTNRVMILGSEESENGDDENDGTGVVVTVTFAITTEETASISIDGRGNVHPYFGGTGITDSEMDEYVQKAVDIRSAITGDDSDCTLKKSINPS